MLNCNEILDHLNAPVCETLTGLRTHLRTMGIGAMWQLCYIFSCNSPESLADKMWDMIKRRKRIKRQDR